MSKQIKFYNPEFMDESEKINLVHNNTTFIQVQDTFMNPNISKNNSISPNTPNFNNDYYDYNTNQTKSLNLIPDFHEKVIDLENKLLKHKDYNIVEELLELYKHGTEYYSCLNDERSEQKQYWYIEKTKNLLMDKLVLKQIYKKTKEDNQIKDASTSNSIILDTNTKEIKDNISTNNTDSNINNNINNNINTINNTSNNNISKINHFDHITNNISITQNESKMETNILAETVLFDTQSLFNYDEEDRLNTSVISICNINDNMHHKESREIKESRESYLYDINSQSESILQSQSQTMTSSQNNKEEKEINKIIKLSSKVNLIQLNNESSNVKYILILRTLILCSISTSIKIKILKRLLRH